MSVNQLDRAQSPHLTAPTVLRQNLGVALSARGYLRNQLILEADFIFTETQFIRQSGFEINNESVRRIHVPILFRWEFLEYFSLGAGVYASYRMGEVKMIDTPPSGNILQTSAADSGEHGMEASVAFHWPLENSLFGFTVDARHGYSLTPRDNEERNYQSLLFIIDRKIN